MSGIPILTFHSIDSSGSVISIAPSQFEALLGFLHRHNFETLTVREAAERLRSHAPTGKAIALSFDDGFDNFYTEGFPRLQALNMKATVFVVTQCCGERNDWACHGLSIPQLPLLSWTRIDELNRHGIEIGAHTCSHPDLSMLSREKAEAEISASGKMIEDRTGHATFSFAYPFGSSNPWARDCVRKYYSCAVSTHLATAHSREDVHFLSRIDTYYLRDNPALVHYPWLKPYLAVRRMGRKLRGLLGVGKN